jgi:HSP20 family protein
MTIVQYQPWSLFSRLNRDLGNSLTPPTASAGYVPPVDVHEETERFVVLADLPGVNLADIEITADKGVLTIRGERKQEKREPAQGYERVERVNGGFARRFTLPDNVQADNIKARYNNGVLEVSIPKQAVQEPRRVAIETH